MAERVMYVKPGCPWCDMARDDLKAEGLEWEERDATVDPAWREELMRFSEGSGRVPTVVEGENVVSVGWKGGG